MLKINVRLWLRYDLFFFLIWTLIWRSCHDDYDDNDDTDDDVLEMPIYSNFIKFLQISTDHQTLSYPSTTLSPTECRLQLLAV